MPATNSTSKLAWLFGVLVASAAVAAAQESSSTEKERGNLNQIRKVSTLMGTEVINQSHAVIATIRDVALAPDGRAHYVILGWGGVAGLGETLTAAPYARLGIHQEGEKWDATLMMTADELHKAPTIKTEHCRELTDDQWVARVHEFFRRPDDSDENLAKHSAAGKTPSGHVSRYFLATKIRSAKVKNRQNLELGRVDELLLGQKNEVEFVIVGHGGVLGIGESSIPIPWQSFEFELSKEKNLLTVVIDAQKTDLEKAPLVKKDSYATLLAPGFADQVRRYFAMLKSRH